MNDACRLVVWGAAAVLAGCGDADTSATGSQGTGIRYLGGDDDAARGFERAEAPRELEFPADHGPHAGFRTEWWYFTGNVEAASGRHFGFELTFFRIALAPERPASDSAWATNQVWMAHFALTDTARQRFVAAEEFSRGALGLAGARAEPFDVHVENWSVTGRLGRRDGTLRVQAEAEGAAVDLELEVLKPVVTQGERGFDRKGAEPGNASYYYSIPRLDATGRVRSRGEWHAVEGLAWMDREWSTSALAPGLAGWDWFALQLGDGRDLMYYRLRRTDGTSGRFSGGTLVAADGATRRLTRADVELEPIRSWRSAATGVEYPVAWRLSIPEQALELEVTPVLDAQELDESVRYWEGAVRVEGTDADGRVSGRGYLELAGY